jgi:glycosyltransferase involved in cell wall biosynthesis
MAEERTPQSPPIIASLPDYERRPLWSVMIPVYNCFPYLRSTLESVIQQDPGPNKMQIEVVDDGSTDGDVEALVKEIGKGRIGYFRQKTNRGSLRNFETCLNRSKGQWIHILHGDDMVKPGFYREIKHLFHTYPEAAAAFTGVRYTDEQGRDLYSHKLVSDKEGIVEEWLSKIAQAQWLQPPAIVVKRTVYEQLGGFFAVHYGEDWEMWIRIAANFPVAFSPKYLAAYRVHTNNISSRSLLTGQNIKDLITVIKIAQDYLPEEQRSAFAESAKRNYSIYFSKVCDWLYHTQKNPKAALLQSWAAFRMHRNNTTLKRLIKNHVKYLIRYAP